MDDPALSLGHVITDIKSNNSIKYVYVWHAITGYWGGVKPGVSGMEHYESQFLHQELCPTRIVDV